MSLCKGCSGWNDFWKWNLVVTLEGPWHFGWLIKSLLLFMRPKSVLPGSELTGCNTGSLNKRKHLWEIYIYNYIYTDIIWVGMLLFEFLSTNVFWDSKHVESSLSHGNSLGFLTMATFTRFVDIYREFPHWKTYKITRNFPLPRLITRG